MTTVCYYQPAPSYRGHSFISYLVSGDRHRHRLEFEMFTFPRNPSSTANLTPSSTQYFPRVLMAPKQSYRPCVVASTSLYSVCTLRRCQRSTTSVCCWYVPRCNICYYHCNVHTQQHKRPLLYFFFSKFLLWFCVNYFSNLRLAFFPSVFFSRTASW